jgi:hypothetical protein
MFTRTKKDHFPIQREKAGSHSGAAEDLCLMKCNAKQMGETLQTFRSTQPNIPEYLSFLYTTLTTPHLTMTRILCKLWTQILNICYINLGIERVDL